MAAQSSSSGAAQEFPGAPTDAEKEQTRKQLLDIVDNSDKDWSPETMRILQWSPDFVKYLRQNAENERLDTLLQETVSRLCNSDKVLSEEDLKREAAKRKQPDVVLAAIKTLHERRVVIRDLKKKPAVEDLKGKAKEGS
ncbi:MAG: hypothetical protein Q9198_000299 [Flavoplaca austrocitrina]